MKSLFSSVFLLPYLRTHDLVSTLPYFHFLKGRFRVLEALISSDATMANDDASIVTYPP